MSSPPPTAHDPLALLQQSEYFGVLTANLNRVIDANDAVLRMVGYTSDELHRGFFDWRAMTPPEYVALDDAALEQIRQFGACVPFQKELVLRDGKRLPILIGGIRLNSDPLEWVCFVIDLTAQKRAFEAQRRSRELQAKADVLSVLAHEINNPLQILINALGIIQGADYLDASLHDLLNKSQIAVQRIAASLRAMTAAVNEDAGQADQPVPVPTAGEP